MKVQNPASDRERRMQMRRGGRNPSGESRIPRLTSDPPSRIYNRHDDHKVEKPYGYRRIPTPMPKVLPSSGGYGSRMSRQTRAGPPPSAPSTSGATGGATGSSGIPGPVVQQAQQYLEENIKRWMEPAPQQPSREEIPPLPLENPSAMQEPQISSHPRLPSTSSSSSNPSRQHVLSRAQQALISPSSGYSEHSDRDPFSGLSDEERAICEQAWRQASEAEKVLKQREEAAWRQFPHSLSFGGCSQHSLLQGTSYSTPCGNSPFGVTQPSAAASFFARASQRLNLSAKRKKKNPEQSRFRTNFREIIKNHPPPVPPGLLRVTGRKEVTGVGKVKVMLRMCPSNEADSSYISVDSKKKQVTLYDPTVCGQETSGDRHVGVAAPKMFAFDAVFSPDDNQAEVCSSSLCDVISSVVGGSDGCLFVYGHSKLGKTSTMIGNSNSAQEIGVIPSAIWWLYRAINEHKHRTGARFSVRVSAVELSGKAEELRDLLADYAAAGTEGSGAAPGAYLRDDQTIFGSYLTHQSELRAPTAERAAFLLDAALAARTAENEEDAKNSHFLFTLHVYQYRIEKGERGGVSGGRSRLHLFDLGSCEKTTKSRDGSSGGCLSLSALGNVILALFNGQKHVPYKDSKLTQLLREAMGSVMCRAAMIAHVSTNPSRYPETLATLQLASRIHRLRRKKLKFASADMGPVGDDKGVCRPFVKIHAVGEDGVVKSGGSDQDYTSSSEQSCDTVIFVGSGRGTPLPNNICDRKPSQPMSPLAKETQSGTSGSTGGTPKKQSSKGHHADKSSMMVGTASSGVPSTSKEQKSSEYVSKSALNEQMRVNLSPKKKLSTSSPYSSPKHPKLNDGESPKMSPKMNKYVMMDYSDTKKSRTSGEISAKGSPARTSKSTDIHPKSLPLSATSSPQSQRKSKRSHKHEVSQQILYQQQQAESALKILMKEPKPSSDETWIDGPRFTKPKFDSRTLHQLQKEKWVDGPGMYGYMDVQKETMIRKWVEDHSRIIPESEVQSRKEVWIDFPPNKEEKSSSHAMKNVASTSGVEKHESPLPVEKVKKEHRGKSTDSLQKDHSMEQDKHHSKISKETSKPATEATKENKDKESKSKSVCQQIPPMVSDLDNSINGNLSELLGHSDNGSIQSSSGSVDFNDNNSEDFKDYSLTETNRCLSNSNIHLEDKDGCILLTDNNVPGDVVLMTDCSIQVTEEDIFTSCGWPLVDNHHFSDTDSYEGMEHPLHVLSAEDLNLPSSFTDSRAMSIDFDSLSVPEGWTADTHHLDPDLTWRLLKGNSLPHHGSRTSQTRNLNSNEDIASKNNLLASKLEKLANLRQMIEKTSFNQEGWKPPLDAEGLKRLCSSDNRFPFISKLHHSADSSLEELRENDVNSIRSEPAELDVENFEFQFNVKPMNGLRLEAFYNKIQKVPLFPDCFSQFGKPTQVVPPIIKQQNDLIKSTSEDESLKSNVNSHSNEKEIPEKSPKLKHRWSTCSSKRSTPTKDIIKEHSSETNSDTPKVQNSDALPVFEKCSPSPKRESVQTKAEIHPVPVDKKQSLSEVIQEQRCRVYSEGPSSSPVHFHSPKHVAQRTSKFRITSEHSNHGNHGSKTIEISEQRHEYVLVKQHQRKKGSPKFIPRGFLGSYRSSQKQKQHVQCSYPSVAGANLTDTLTVLSPGSSMTSTHVSSPHVLTEAPVTHGQKSQILIRSTSTPVSPFSNVSSEAVLRGETYTYLSPVPKKESKWAARQSSSGHGSDSSVISADIKDTKELLGKMGKTPQFSGTSSGYESMPRDSEGTPLSSSSQESGSEVGAKKEARGRKGTRKKTQGSNKRSRSVPARPPVNNSPTWQQQQQQQQQQSTAVSRQQLRGRLVRDLHDPTLWKSEEDVCCTSLLCCRLLDFY